jgi:hypothetical protein
MALQCLVKETIAVLPRLSILFLDETVSLNHQIMF